MYLGDWKTSKIIFSLLISGFSWLNIAFAGIYKLDYTAKEKEAKIKRQEGIFLKMRFKDKALRVPIFLYQIEKIKGPHKLTEKVLKESLFFLEKGNFFFSQGDYLKAIEFYKKSSEVNPSFVVSYLNQGLAYFLLGEYTQSIKNFEKLIELEPLNPYPYFYLGWIYERLENPYLAQDYLKKAKEICKHESNQYLLKNIEVLLSILEKEEFIKQ